MDRAGPNSGTPGPRKRYDPGARSRQRVAAGRLFTRGRQERRRRAAVGYPQFRPAGVRSGSCRVRFGTPGGCFNRLSIEQPAGLNRRRCSNSRGDRSNQRAQTLVRRPGNLIRVRRFELSFAAQDALPLHAGGLRHGLDRGRQHTPTGNLYQSRPGAVRFSRNRGQRRRRVERSGSHTRDLRSCRHGGRRCGFEH